MAPAGEERNREKGHKAGRHVHLFATTSTWQCSLQLYKRVNAWPYDVSILRYEFPGALISRIRRLTGALELAFH